jgi:hypothetical protein
MWDEFPDALDAIRLNEGPEAAAGVLAQLRAYRQADELDRIRWVLTGSIGLHHVTRHLGDSSGLNDLTVLRLPPLSGEWTEWLAESLLLGANLTPKPGQAAAMAQVSGGIPFILELMVKHIVAERLTVPDQAAEAEALLLRAASDRALSANWAPLLERVGKHYGDLAPAAERILDLTAAAPMTEPDLRQVLHREHPSHGEMRVLLDLLCDDHYLRHDPDSGLYSWLHRPLRIIWQARRREPA